MPYINFTEKLFGLQDLIITNTRQSNSVDGKMKSDSKNKRKVIVKMV